MWKSALSFRKRPVRFPIISNTHVQMQTAAMCKQKQQPNNDVGKETVLFWSNTQTLLNILHNSSFSAPYLGLWSVQVLMVCVCRGGGLGWGVDQNHCWIYNSLEGGDGGGGGGGGHEKRTTNARRKKHTPRNQTFYTVAHQASGLNMNAPYKLIDTHNTQSVCSILIIYTKTSFTLDQQADNIGESTEKASFLLDVCQTILV